MTILIDMDDTIEQLVPAWVNYLNAHYGTDTRPEDVRSWNMNLSFPTLTEEQIFSALHDDCLWDDVIPMPGAVEALRQLSDDGHELMIVTATTYQTLRAKMDKVLFRYFPFISWNQVIITSRKQLVRGDIMIDDGPHNLAGGEYHKILFQAGHNLDFDEASIGAVRVRSWAEAYAQVCRIAGTEECTAHRR